MSWLRIDDKFVRHPKIEALTDVQFRVWIRLLCYCAEYDNGGVFTPKLVRNLPGITSKRIANFITIGLLDEGENDTVSIHDFAHYNPRDPTARERMSRFRNRNADRNTDRNDVVTETVPRARAGARVPVPYPLKGREGDEGVGAASPPGLNGRAPLTSEQTEIFAAYVHRVWDDYPDPIVIRDELLDRGIPLEQADAIIATERKARTP